MANPKARNTYAAYKNVEAKTASPVQLVVLLYEGAVKHIRKGEALLQGEDSFHAGAEHVLRAMCIVTELAGILNPQASPDLARNLSGIYQHIIGLLSQALRERDPETLPEAAGILESLGSAWRQLTQGAA
ncbi:MAG: flagellar export chaperone FliS [Candidatus Tectomicrobia bacterium RIFCSPLOWO2_12_FULL_69_37]|nr:MAG: flagellar export chaperone FliS [Candidatus Tectomicrobia bacterium RIFCSPLOWO2_02_FULL_70_19]OGL67278.1 MAG: flagellar export chaperone FliS [Candidatus Tectomicrobia bacterium RIFCSPLOWO2_12_FULL_69_37]